MIFQRLNVTLKTYIKTFKLLCWYVMEQKIYLYVFCYIKSLRIKTCCCFLHKEQVHLRGGGHIAPAHIYSSPEKIQLQGMVMKKSVKYEIRMGNI